MIEKFGTNTLIPRLKGKEMKDISPIVYPKQLPNTKAWKNTSIYVRLTAYGKCYTCGAMVPFKKLHAGHLIEKLGCAAIYFELDGIRGQCYRCNRLLHGNKAIFTLKLIDEIGEERVRELHKMASKPKFWRKNELDEIAERRGKYIKVIKYPKLK
jgi:hypothetical protein